MSGSITKFQPYLQYLILLVLIYLVIFLKLGSFHMRWWDESMFAVNTYEMIQNGNWFALYFDNNPDLYNTKPPVTNWLQVIFVKFIGYNETAIRLPSAIAAALTVLLVFGFVKKYWGNIEAWFASLVLLTANGFIHFHTARTGDSDALLTLFTTISCFAFIQYTQEEKSKYLLLSIIFLLLGFLTKLYAALLFTPVFLIILIQSKKLKSTLTSPYFWVGIVSFVGISFGVLYARELTTPGYFHELIFKDAGRVFVEVENHKEPFFFYIENLFDYRFQLWIIPALLGAVITLSKSDSHNRKAQISILWMVISYLLIISISLTKLEWYDMPLLPLLAILTVPTFKLIYSEIGNLNKTYRLILLFGFIFLFPFIEMFNKSQANTIPPGQKTYEANEIFLSRKGHQSFLQNSFVLSKDWKGSLLFYKYKLHELGTEINIINSTDQLSINDRVLVSKDELKSQLKKSFELEVIDQHNEAVLYQINSVKR